MENKEDRNLMHVKRGDVYLCDLGETRGSEQSGKRPVVVIQNSIGCRFSPTVMVVPITSKMSKAKLPTHVELKASVHGLLYDSVCLGEQARAVDKSRLKDLVTTLDSATVSKIKQATFLNMEDDEEFAALTARPKKPELMVVG